MKKIKKRLRTLRGIMMDLSVKVIDEQEKTIVSLAGEIDVYTAPKLKNTLLPLVTEKDRLVEVDFNEVGYMDSTGLGVFISALKIAKECESHLLLTNLNKREHRLFQITGLNQLIDVNPKVEVNKNNGIL